jgi:hypothetical protein
MDRYFKLIGKMAVQCDTLLEWAEWMELNSRRVAQDEIEGIEVSTVFLGLNHNFSGKGDPLLFETMVFFPEEGSGTMWRYFTWAEAEAGHKEILDSVKQQLAEANTVTLETIRKFAKTEKFNGNS